MKVTIDNNWGKTGVRLTQGNQSFFLDYTGDREACKWYAKMFRKALRNHNEEQKEKWRNSKTQ